ncbi:MAG: hypothetical protein JWL77_6291 [Chthonomonadaceae bacterium]|nr:hypothetical protein [Chthonomonadaceae bacterium]
MQLPRWRGVLVCLLPQALLEIGRAAQSAVPWDTSRDTCVVPDDRFNYCAILKRAGVR